MTDHLHITDHALLGWMERAYGINVAEWRRVMRSEAEAALRQFEPTLQTGSSFVVSAQGKVVGYCEDQSRKSFLGRSLIFVPRPPAADPTALPSEETTCRAT